MKRLYTGLREQFAPCLFSERYRSAAHTLYDQAMVELEAGDLRQASEKFLGCVGAVDEGSGGAQRVETSFASPFSRNARLIGG